MYFTNLEQPGTWNLHVVTCRDTYEWLKTLFPRWNFKATILPYTNLTQQQYNSLLMDPMFWKEIDQENVLIFQTDVIMFRGNIGEFTHYDFIGANFFDVNDVSFKYGGNNGGFSFRHRSAMLECIENVSPMYVEQYLASHGKQMKPALMEDVYFTSACEIIGKKMSTFADRKFFSIEDGTKEYYATPVGCHKFASPQLAHCLLDLLAASALRDYVPNTA
jgi:hypothetical protein